MSWLDFDLVIFKWFSSHFAGHTFPNHLQHLKMSTQEIPKSFLGYWSFRYAMATELYIVEKWEKITIRKNFLYHSTHLFKWSDWNCSPLYRYPAGRTISDRCLPELHTCPISADTFAQIYDEFCFISSHYCHFVREQVIPVGHNIVVFTAIYNLLSGWRLDITFHRHI